MRTALGRARAAAEAIIIEVLTRGSCESDDDLEAIAAMIAVPIQAAIVAERDALADDYEAAMEAGGLTKYLRERIHESVDQRASAEREACARVLDGMAVLLDSLARARRAGEAK